jgi:HSP20 family protein
MVSRFDPFREVDRLAGELWGQRPRSRTMPIDVYRTGEELVALLDLPGIDPETIELTVDKRVLTVSAERSEAFGEGSETLVSERPTGWFVRRVRLGDGLDLDRVQAGYDNGVLRISVPLVEKAKPRRIQVTVSTPATSITAEAGEEAAAQAA